MQPHVSRLQLLEDRPPHIAELPLAPAPPSLKVVSSSDKTRFFFVKNQGSAQAPQLANAASPSSDAP
jgi:hypothetical protein